MRYSPLVLLLSLVTHQSFLADQALGQFGTITRFSYGPDERRAAFNMRLASNYERTFGQAVNYLPLENNGDEKSVPNYASQFSKTLQHDPTTGILTTQGQQSYVQMVQAVGNGQQSAFNAIVRAPGATIKLVNPQAAFAFCLQGCDSSLFSMPLFPNLDSPELAALMIECYLFQLCRDVYFSDYGTGTGTDTPGLGVSNSKTNDAAAVLQALGSAYTGPLNEEGGVDASVLFRGNSSGCLIGPYISQFMLLPLLTAFPTPSLIGAQNLAQAPFVKLVQQWPIASGREFGVSFADFIVIQNGQVPNQYVSTDYDPTNKRFFIDGRDMGSFVHSDVNCENMYYAAYILISYGFPFSTALPYYNGDMLNESAFVTMAGNDVLAAVEGIVEEALRAAWAQKWRANRAIRPEAFSGLVHVAQTTGMNPYNLYSSLFTPQAGVNVLAQVQAYNTLQANYPASNLTPQQAATYLFTQQFPEGCPAHPTYPSAHATISGACATVIKAFFQNDTLINSIVVPVKPNPSNPTQLIPLVDEGETVMTVASEIDKLAFNIAFARSFAGVHYRCDGLQGILLGEQVGILWLQDLAMLYTEQDFTGFVLTQFDGTQIQITGTSVTVLPS